MQIVIFSSPQRKEMLNNLLSELVGFDVFIIDDPSTFGKDNFWKRWELARLTCLRSNHDNYLILPDDICQIDIEKIKFLHLKFKNNPFVCSVISDGRKSCWGSRINHSREFKSENYIFTDIGFFDCGGATNRTTLEKFSVIKPHKRFAVSGKSSGVGHQITQKLRALRIPMYNSSPSLSFHGAHESVMHPLERLKNPLTTMKKLPVYVGMATFKGRPVQNAIDSLLPQVDQIFLYDNEKFPDLTDNGKFWGLSQIKEPCYYFTCDDDLKYPPNYIQKTIEAIEKHKCIITHHGRVLQGLDRSYYTGHKSVRCLSDNLETIQLHVPGTGVTAFRTDYFNPKNLHKAKDKKMSDIVFGLEAAKQGKKIMTIPHTRNWIKQLPIDHSTSIHTTESKNQSRQIELANEIFTILAL